MEFSVKNLDDVVVLHVDATSLGGPGAHQMSNKIRSFMDQGISKFIVDMEKVEWMNSSGLGIVIGALHTVTSRNGRLCLINISEKTEQLLKITKLERVFSIFNSEEEAVADFSE